MEFKPFGDALEVGTRVHWDEPSQCLYYVDRPVSKIYKYKPSTGIITTAKVGSGSVPLVFVFPVEGYDDLFIAGLGRDIGFIRWDGITNSVCTCSTIGEVDRSPALATNRLNGGKIDPFGRLWTGTMGPNDEHGNTVPGKGSFYSVTHGKIKRHFSDVGISNGIAFDVELQKMYYADSLFPGIFQFDYDGESGEISNKKIIYRFEDHGVSGSPDGLTIDRTGNLLISVMWGSKIIKIDPRTGALLRTINMPTPQITSIAFGNKHLNALYVTTARMRMPNGTVPRPPAGCTFVVEHLGNKGPSGFRYKP